MEKRAAKKAEKFAEPVKKEEDKKAETNVTKKVNARK